MLSNCFDPRLEKRDSVFVGETELREEAMGRLVGETAYGYENRAA